MRYDHIIVGAGSAGCVLANRLTAAGRRVLLLEAGGSDRNLNVRIPAAFSSLFHTKRDWDYHTAPEPQAGDRRLYLPRGKMLGGSSSMNAMIYVRGRASDYDRWRDELGLDGWGYADVLPYFRRSEDNARGEGPFHGAGGELRVEDPTHVSTLTHRFVGACEAAGIPRNDDVNGATQDGAGVVQVTQREGRRWSAADGFLRPALDRDELTVATGVVVRRVLLEGGRAVGVEVLHRDRVRTARVEPGGEVILAAGAIGSPQLLMLSGIGPADHLRHRGVTVHVDLPVGDNLQDHPFVSMAYETTSTDTLNDAESLRHLARFLVTHRGKLASNVGEAVAFARSSDAVATPDLQYHFAPAHFVEHGAVTFDGHSFTFGPVLVTPASRGTVRLRAADAQVAPEIRMNVFAAPDDLDRMVDGVLLGRRIAAQSPLADVTVREVQPGPAIGDDRDAIASWVRRNVELLYHPSCTAPMGADGAGVVDPQLRVHGVDGLRVVDASVFPEVPRGNTNAPTIMVAEKAADLLTGAGTGR